MAVVAADEIAGGVEAPPAIRHAEDQAADAARRKADAELVDLLTSHSFAGPQWDRFAEELCKYGIPVLMAWLATGQIFSATRNAGMRLTPSEEDLEALRQDRDARAEITYETIARAVRLFREMLIRGRWDAAGGAGLKTYFVGAVVRSFPNVFNTWASERRRASRVNSIVESELTDRPAVDNTNQVLDRMELQSLLASLDLDTRRILTLKMVGYTHDEIGGIVGLSAKAIEGRLYRLRSRSHVEPLRKCG